MTGLDELKDAMETTPDFQPGGLDVGPIMAAGGRVRRRRRLATGTASGLAVVALLVGGGQLLNTTGPASTTAGVQPHPSVLNSSAPGILGTIVNTGRRVDGREWIIYVETVDPDRLNVNLTLVLGRTRTGYIDDFTRDIISRDPGRKRMSPGFHAVRASTVVQGRTTPTFGYYAGDAARITARDAATGRTVEAHLTAWSGFDEGERARIFWFDFMQGRTPAKLSGLTAYDRDGKKLPTGDAG